MIGFGWVGERRHDKEYLFGQRQLLLIRAALAALLILVLLLAVWPAKEESEDKDADVGSTVEDSVVVAPPAETDDAMTEEQTGDMPLAEQRPEEPLAVEAVDVEPAAVVRIEAPAPARKGEKTVDAAAGRSAGNAAAHPAPATAERGPAVAAVRDKAVAEKRFRVVVGDFLEPVAASKLCDQLMNDGYGLSMQHRVTVGPYASHGEAENMVSKLHREQQTRGMIVNTAGAAFLVQLGVFSEPANAQGLLERLTKAGYSAQVHMRIMAGPFSDKQTAEAAAAKLRQRASVNTMVVAAP